MDRYEDNLNKYLYLVELQVTKPDKGTVYLIKSVVLISVLVLTWDGVFREDGLIYWAVRH